MTDILKQKGLKLLQWAVQNPRKFFIYSMVFLTISFIMTIVQGVFFPSQTAFTIRPPILYSKNDATQYLTVSKEKEMEKIVNELKTLKVKRDEASLKKEDSLRIDYLFNQYQKLKNGH